MGRTMGLAEWELGYALACGYQCSRKLADLQVLEHVAMQLDLSGRRTGVQAANP